MSGAVRLETGLIDKQILHILTMSKEKPYISYWGELYYLLYKMKRKAEQLRQNIMLYHLPSGTMIFNYRKKRFIAMIPDMNIALKDHELADALFKGALVPEASLQAEPEDEQIRQRVLVP